MLDKLGSFLTKLKPKNDDDAVDRLNYIWTNFIILIFAITVAAKAFVGEPLQCWVPAQFTGGWEKYVEQYCFVENTFWLPMHDQIPISHQEREDRELLYYQWVPFVLALQAVMFYFPRLLWSQLNGHTGMSITKLVQEAFTTKKEKGTKVLKPYEEPKIEDDDETREGKLKKLDVYRIASHMDTVLTVQTKPHGDGMTKAMTKKWGSFVTVLYLFVKFLFIVNLIVQFFVLNSFLNPSYTWWGFGILGDLANGRPWEESGHFPRVTLCDVEVRQLASLHRWTVQCVLVINMFNEKIYLFLWFWFLLVGFLTILNFVYWTITSFYGGFAHDFIARYLAFEQVDASDHQVRHFIDHSLHRDGITVLRLLSANCGDVVTSRIVHHLWMFQFASPVVSRDISKDTRSSSDPKLALR